MMKWIVSALAAFLMTALGTASATPLVAYSLQNVTAPAPSAAASFLAPGVTASTIAYTGISNGIVSYGTANAFDAYGVTPGNYYSFSVTFPRGGTISSLNFVSGANDFKSLPLVVEWSTTPSFATFNTLGSVTVPANGNNGTVFPPTNNLSANTTPLTFSAATYYFRIRTTGSLEYFPSQWTINNIVLSGNFDPSSVPTIPPFGLALLALMLVAIAMRARSIRRR